MVDKKQQWKGWLYLLPCLILLAVFTFWPIINSLRLAFIEGYNRLDVLGGTYTPDEFVYGFNNFKVVIEDTQFKRALLNTLILTVITVPASTLLALFISVCLNSIKPLNRLFQTIFFIPYVTNSIAIGMVFACMFNVIGSGANFDSIGLINTMLSWFGLCDKSEPLKWVSAGSATFKYVPDPDYPGEEMMEIIPTWRNFLVMIIYIIWNALPFKILILLGGLQSVNKQYYDAAKIDATSKARVFWRITVPLLSPMIAYVIITGFIGGFKEYSSVIGVFGAKMGPADAPRVMETIVGYIYESILSDDLGVASAGSLILFAIIMAITAVNLYVSKKKVHY